MLFVFCKRLILSSVLFLFLNSLFAEEAVSTKTYRISELVQRAIENSQELKLMDQDIDRTKKELKFAKTSYLPHLTLQGSAGVDLLSPGSFDASKNIGSDLILDWNFFQNGLVFLRVAQAKAQVELAVLGKKRQEIDLACQIQNRIFEILEKQAAGKIQSRELELERKNLEKAREEFQHGKNRRMDVLKVQTQVFEKQNILEKIKRENEFLLNKFKEDTGLSLSDNFEIEWDPIDSVFSQTKEACLEIALANRVEVREGEIQCQLSEKSLRVAKLGRLPRLDLFAGNAFALDDFERSSNQFQFRTGVIARYPLYDGGETKLQIILAEIAKRKADFQWDQGKRKITEEVEKAYGQMLDAQALRESGKSQLETIQAELQQSQIEYQNGNLSALEWEEALLTSGRAKFNDEGLQWGVLRAQAALAKTMGFKSLEEAFAVSKDKAQNPPLEKSEVEPGKIVSPSHSRFHSY